MNPVPAGIGVLMLVALTVERYLAVCHLGRNRTFSAQKTPLIAAALAVAAISLYVPYVFRAHMLACPASLDGHITYQKRENVQLRESPLWSIYLWLLEVIFKVGQLIIAIRDRTLENSQTPAKLLH